MSTETQKFEDKSHTSHWTFMTNHSHVLLCLWKNPHLRLRDVAELVGITERSVQGIVRDLEEGGVITREREGRRNSYHIHQNIHLRHRLESHQTIGCVLEILNQNNPVDFSGSEDLH